jgi:class 3 adenylate cyclase
MTCSSCGHENGEGARFCEACGSPLGSSCKACGAEVRAGARFCEACGAPIGAAKRGEPSPAPRPPSTALPDHLAEKVRAAGASLAGERKQVTVLFADVMDSMELAEQCDPEEWRRIMERFFALLCEGVHRFEGTVDKFTGDGAMALFGAPIAHEDHAARACQAALHLNEELATFSAELRSEHGLNFLVRIGLNSGEVVVGSIGEDLAMDYTAIGHTVGLAQRMEALAEPGKAYLTEHTAALAEGYFDLRDLGEFTVKGVHEPLRVHELSGLGRLRTRFEVSRAHGLSRFVGREEETATLEAALARASEGDAQVVCVVGEAGVGKSRLCYEFAERCRERGIDVWEGHCKARGESLPLMPLLEVLRSYFGIADRDTGQAAREKIAGRALLLDESLKEELPLLFDLLGVSDAERPEPIDPEARQRRLFAAFNRLAAARSELAVYLIEDLHWIDPGSAAFLENLVDGLPGTRTLVIANFRPGYQAEWMQRSYCGRLALAPLRAEASEELLRGLLGSDPSLDGLAEQIRERTGGNPFFIEELIQGLAEGGSLVGERGAYRLGRPLDEGAIPATVQAVIAARIDHLTERGKQLLRTAAVIGREFTEPVLRRVAGLPEPELRAALRALLNGELIYQQTLVPEPEYSFKHQLIEEVAYRSQLADARARLHGEVARATEELYPDRLDELAALVSRHLEQAGEKLAAARWGARAAVWAGFADPVEALRHWQRVSKLTDSAPESDEAAAIGTWARMYIITFGWRLGADEAEVRRTFDEARELAKRSGDVRALAFALAAYAHTRVMAGEAADHIDMLLQALRLAEQTGDSAARAAAVGVVAWGLFLTGRMREALDVMEPTWKLWDEDPSLGSGFGVECPYPLCVWLSADIRTVLGELNVQEAHEEFERALALALEHADVENAGWAHTRQVWLCWMEGDTSGALEHANRAVEIAERTGGTFLRGDTYGHRGLAHVLRGEWDEAIAELERSLEILREARTPSEGPWRLAHLAEAYLGAGQSERARETAKQAVVMAVTHGTRYYELVAQLVLVRVLIGAEGVGAKTEIEAALERLAALIEEIGARGYEPFLHEQRARLAELSGDTERRERELRTAQRLFEALGARARAAGLAAECGQVVG